MKWRHRYMVHESELKLQPKCPFCFIDLEIWKAKKGYYAICYKCRFRGFGRSASSFSIFNDPEKGQQWTRIYCKGKAKNGSFQFFDHIRGLRMFVDERDVL